MRGDNLQCDIQKDDGAWLQAKSGSSEDEQTRVQGAVRLLMDCVADIVEHEGLDVLPAMSQVPLAGTVTSRRSWQTTLQPRSMGSCSAIMCTVQHHTAFFAEGTTYGSEGSLAS